MLFLRQYAELMKPIISQKELAELLGNPKMNMSAMLAGKRRVSPATALKLEKNSGVGRFVWLYGTPKELKRELEKSLGRKINFKRGRVPKKERSK